MTGDTSPPSAWYDPKECPVDGCDETRFVPLALDLHTLRDHGGRGPRPVAEQIDSGVQR